MKYAIAKWYITNFAVYEALDGSLLYLMMDWDMFVPHIAEPVNILTPLVHKELKAQLVILQSLQAQLDKRIPSSNLRVVSVADKYIFLAAEFPCSKIHQLSLEEFQNLSAEQALSLVLDNDAPQPSVPPTIEKNEYQNFLKFIVTFKDFSSENILTLYSKNPAATDVKTVGEWLRSGATLVPETLKNAIPLRITLQQEFFERHGKIYPIEYAVQSERTAIAQHKLPVMLSEKESLLLVIDVQQILGEPFFPPRDCDAQQFSDTIMKLAKMQGFEIKIIPQINDSYYQGGVIYLPLNQGEEQSARMLCREYATAVCQKTLSLLDCSIANLYADSLAWVFAYRYGLERNAEYLQEYWEELHDRIDIRHLSKYLHQALLYLDSRLATKLLPTDEQLAQIKNNFLQDIPPAAQKSEKSKFHNKKGASA